MPSLLRKKVAAAIAAVATSHADDTSIWRLESAGHGKYTDSGYVPYTGNEDMYRGAGLRMGVVLTSVYRTDNAYALGDPYGNSDWSRAGTLYTDGYDSWNGKYLGTPSESPRRLAKLGIPRLSQLVSLDVEGFLRGDPVEVPDVQAVDNAYRGDYSLNTEFFLAVAPAPLTARIGDFIPFPAGGDDPGVYDAFMAHVPPQTWKNSYLFGPTRPLLALDKQVPVIKNTYYQFIEPTPWQPSGELRTSFPGNSWVVLNGDYSMWMDWDLAGPGTHIKFMEPIQADISDWQTRMRATTDANQKAPATVTPYPWIVLTLPNPYGIGVPYRDENGQLH